MRDSTRAIIEDELRSNDFSHKPSWTTESDDLVLRVWRQRYCIEEGDYHHREIHFLIDEHHQAVSVGHFVEWRAPPISYLDEFVDEADDWSIVDRDMALLVSKHWKEGVSPFDYGTIVRFERLTIEAAKRSSVIWNLIQSIIQKEFLRRGSLLLLKAFPLEYEGNVTGSNRAAFESRVAALQRLYVHRLGMTPIPFDKDGWMWRPLRYCPNPERQKRR